MNDNQTSSKPHPCLFPANPSVTPAEPATEPPCACEWCKALPGSCPEHSGNGAVERGVEAFLGRVLAEGRPSSDGRKVGMIFTLSQRDHSKQD